MQRNAVFVQTFRVFKINVKEEKKCLSEKDPLQGRQQATKKETYEEQ